MSPHQEESGLDLRDAAERRTLKWVLAINFSQVVLAGAVGIVADFAGLLAATLDNLPIGLIMIVTAILNAATSVLNLRLLRAHRERGVHLKASWIFTTNDMLANLGIVASGIAVMVFKSQLPDLLIGLVVVGIVLKGGWDILEEAREACRAADSGSAGTRS